MASTLRRSDPKLSASLLKNYSYVHSDGIQESLSGTPLQLNGHFYDISSQAFLTKENFKPLICCVLNACCQHKFLLADRILTAIITCFTVAPNLYNTLVDNEYVNNMEMLFMNICKIKDWDRSVPCVRLLNACTQTMIEHNRRANLDRIYRRILRKICNAIAKYHITIDDKGSDTTFELRNLYEAVSLLRNLLLLLLHVGINFYVDIEPFIRSIRDIKCIVVISVAREIALGTTDVESVFKCIDTVYNNPLIWRKCMLKVSYTDQRMIDNDIVLLNIHDAVASFTRTNITILPIDTMDMAIELPLISCIDFQDKNDSLIFYFDVNLTYIKENLPNKVACGFRHQLAMQYRFIVTCMKTSCIKKLEYDKAVIDFYKERVNCDAYISRCTTSDAIISGTIQKGSINPITKCSYISMELPVNNHIYSAPYISYSTIGEETPYTALQWQTPTLHHQYLTKSGQNSPYGSTLPPSFNRVCSYYTF
ncbi:hypothetical protein BBOV_II003444 [Babesia bovis T2Bo]|uniref:hypothetical protein n=1 Tax=Babesia bovis T2Bo TaxID=484906 RepID=UPI001C35DB62|nr:hypothetical protein BBOV_II003444 [Babesia bovis T2Bo]KAG6440154.1 hypothetical protein BBOV_II003444 [Babesia bovis T2Bo]